MKFSKGKVNNINQKLISGALAFALLTTGLTGCSDVSISEISYTVNEQDGSQNIDGTVSYETLKCCSFYKVYNPNKPNGKYYTIALKDDYNGTLFVKYYDIFTGVELKYGNHGFQSIETVENYLINLDMVKKEYTEEELKGLLNKFIETEINSKKNNKQLVK